ncbi:M48 family metallopeptidase [Algoriphagus sp.]|uniref:M48 family metallopeptidase n=1 Tax=Algoriphagus sp. TaxID=1872435 RepID=UPI003F7009E7
MRDTFQFGSREIEYEINFSDRKTLGITVTPDSEVLVKAPISVNREKIQEVLKKRAAWILKQQSFFLSFQPRLTERRYISGETHLYLGRQYRLMVVKTNQDSVKLLHGELRVESTDPGKAKSLLKEWYLKQARKKFQVLASELIQKFKHEGVVPESLVIRDMALRWGSCTPKGKIILNPELIKAPKGCIEYVIVHELCHLVHRDHSSAFFRLQSRYLPDWEKWKEKLERMMA